MSTLVTVCQIFFSAMAAYAFARLRWRGRDTVFGLFLAGLMVPAIFTLLPNFVLIKQLGLVDTLLGIALPTMFMTPFAVFFLRQFFMNIPREVEEAALIDGAGKVRVFFRVIAADGVHADHHARDPDVHHRLERLLLAADGVVQRQFAGAHRGAGDLPGTDPADRAPTGPG